MNLIIHRGTHEIGGTCVEIATDGGTRIIIDLGMPLSDPRDKTKKLKNFSLTGKTVPELIGMGILPKVSGLYWGVGDEKPVNAIFLSHPHQDHYGLFPYVRKDIPVYLGEDTDKILRASEVFLGDRFGVHDKKVLLKDRTPPDPVEDIKVTPFLVDHSAYGAMAFLIEADGKRVFYSGDFRGHGRKAKLFEKLIADPPPDIDALLMEGTMMGRQAEDTQTEDELELVIADEARVHEGMKLFICSGQNIDRLVTFYRATKRSNATFVLDLYAVNILQEINDRGTLPVPSPGFKDVKVLFTKHFMKRLLHYKKEDWFTRWRPHEISPAQLQRAGKRCFVMFRDSSVHELKGIIPKDSVMFYSMWSQYTLEPAFEKTLTFLDENKVAFKEVHTSGHAILSDLKRLAGKMKPGIIIPIHTERPEEYRRHFGGKVQCLLDGEAFNI
ncbi:MAG TPA: MBL fold metallo-hydrolase [Candidatus Omnitrophota bacterium]|nr:MBL fold metallo-hydrolase [Candidatus Omnitrophota bacterium]